MSERFYLCEPCGLRLSTHGALVAHAKAEHAGQEPDITYHLGSFVPPAGIPRPPAAEIPPGGLTGYELIKRQLEILYRRQDACADGDTDELASITRAIAALGKEARQYERDARTVIGKKTPAELRQIVSAAVARWPESERRALLSDIEAAQDPRGVDPMQ